ncbi:MAG TPA: hypothetical protein VG962_01540 [Steroidobacteraceae bacterium]|nr:hypothetical protein [Steroidobacteraceae bacterium]
MQREIKISFKAILAGCAADVFSTAVLFSVLSYYVMVQKGFKDSSSPEILGLQISNAIHDSPVLFGIQTAIGLGCSILGGYVAGRVAKQDEVENAIAASLIFVAFGIYAIIAGSTDAIALNVFSTLITPFFYRLGAQVRIRQVAKRSR